MQDIYIRRGKKRLLAAVKAMDAELKWDEELALEQCRRDEEAAPGPELRLRATSAAIVRWAAA